MAMRSTQLDGIANAQPETCLEPRRESMQRSQTSSSRCLVQYQLPRARAALKNGDRDLKRATRANGFVWSFYLLFWAGRRALHELARGGINAPQRRDLRERDAIGSKLHTFFGGRTAPGGLSR